MGPFNVIDNVFQQLDWAHPSLLALYFTDSMGPSQKSAIIFGSFNGPILDHWHCFSPHSMGPFNIIDNLFQQLY
jgi:hypothetical protein